MSCTCDQILTTSIEECIQKCSFTLSTDCVIHKTELECLEITGTVNLTSILAAIDEKFCALETDLCSQIEDCETIISILDDIEELSANVNFCDEVSACDAISDIWLEFMERDASFCEDVSGCDAISDIWDELNTKLDEIFADNGLNVSGDTTLLGGTLIQDTTIHVDGNDFVISGDNAYGTLRIIGTGVNTALYGYAANGTAVRGESSTSFGIYGSSISQIGGLLASVSSYGLQATSVSGIAANLQITPATDNNIAEILRVERKVVSNGQGDDGIGSSITFYNKMKTGSTTYEACNISGLFTDATVATRKGELQFFTTHNAVSSRKLAITSSGDLIADALQTFADDAAAGVGGLVANTIYKTATGELRIKL